LGRVVPPRRAIAASSAREGDKVWNVHTFSVHKVLETLFYPDLVVDHDFGLKVLETQF
jgi:hypothetical protein